MGLFFGKNNPMISLSDKYYNLLAKQDKFEFQDYVKLNSPLLSVQQCQNLYNKTFLSDEFPLGLVDKYSLIGSVQTNVAEIEKFNNKLTVCLKYFTQSEDLNNVLKNVIKCFVPLKEYVGRPLRDNGSGCSMHWFKGAIFLSLPKQEANSNIELLLNIAHELGHQCLMIYQDADAIIPDGIEAKVYSAIRKTDRPSILSFHALVAIYFMLKLCVDLLSTKDVLDAADRVYLQRRYIELKSEFLIGAFALKNTRYTQLGLNIYNEMLDFYEKLKS